MFLNHYEFQDGALLRVYDDIQQEIQDKSDIIKKYKAKVKSIPISNQDGTKH